MALSAEKKDFLVNCAQSIKFAGKALFPNRFRRPFDPIHDKIFELLEDTSAQQKAIAVPRGLGKTSICNLLLPARAILLQDARYIVPVSLSSESAIEQTENLKSELQRNRTIRAIYGEVKGPVWSKQKWITKVGSREIMVRPRGAGQQIRGRLFRDYRPDLIIVDDLEDPEDMDTAVQRKKKKKWFYADLMNSIDRSSDDWQIIVLGTILHQDSLLMNLLDSPNWKSVSLRLADDNLRSNAPAFMDDEDVKELYDSYKEDGELGVFFREYMNNPNVSGEDASFQPKFFKSYDETSYNLNTNPDVENILLVDPSRTSTPGANPTGLVEIGVNMVSNKIHVRECVFERLKPEEMYDEIARIITQFRVDVLGVEVTGLHEFIIHPLKTFLSQRGIYIEIVELQAREGRNEKGKAARVRGLVDYYRQGLIAHNDSGVCDPLESQLLSFPNAKEWGLMDPLGYLVEILEKGERYLSPRPGPNEYAETRADVEAEYAVLTDDYYNNPLEDFRVFD